MQKETNLNPTEIIATKLLGWERSKTYPKEQGIRFTHHRFIPAIFDSEFDFPIQQNWGWPNLADWNDIRRMEDALAEKGLLVQYANALWKLCPSEGDWEYNYQLLAIPDQRVAAALKVIKEAGL